MTKATFTLRLPPSIKNEAARLAKREGVSLNQWIVVAVTEKIAATRAATEMSKSRT
jgi:predicted HicB family RNase H-like nuclease